MNTYETYFADLGQRARKASASLALLTTEEKNQILEAVAQALVDQSAAILEANQKDLSLAEVHQVPSVMMDRLRLSQERIEQMAVGLRQLVDLADPVGRVLETIERPNGLHIVKKSVPLGVVAMIYEARPNVTIDAAALSLKTGNAVILRGGKEAFQTNQVLVDCIRQVLASLGYAEDAVQLVTLLDREAVPVLLRQRQYIDVVIPRGGAGLIRRVVEESSIPVIETGSGVCHTYVDAQADLEKAIPIIINAKMQRPSVCNSMETLLVHKDIAGPCLEGLKAVLQDSGLRIHGNEDVAKSLENVIPLTEQSFHTEYNDLDLNVKIVDSLDAAIDHITKHTTHHSEAIITEDPVARDTFMNRIDASTVYVNASTRFTDGFEFGLGAEIGISTQKLHARGPMGLDVLTTYKYLVFGDGQIRQ
ncbi:MAG: glutamate-5-semialdehyde dehydrogenase [Veillonella sp.]|nr:glutamate-5-semialdehyde dehydrogenase [Veillonella sp.]